MGWGTDPDRLSIAMAQGVAERTGYSEESLEYKIAYRDSYAPVGDTEGNEYLDALDKEIDDLKRKIAQIHPSADAFLIEVKAKLGGCVISADLPDDPSGETFFDIADGGKTCAVSFKPGLGFGFFGTVQADYGEQPELVVSAVGDAVQELMRRLSRA